MIEKKKKMQLGIESHEFFDFLAQIQKVTAENDDVNVDIWSKEPPFRAVLEWTETAYEAETVRDEFELAGECYTCGDCPHLDYSDYWKSKKKYPCKYSKYGQTFKTSHACELFYKELIQGEIVPEGVNQYEADKRD